MQRKISISIPPDLLAAVDQAAHTEHRPRSAMIALILRAALKVNGPKAGKGK
jgi:metal-responsive CopG/Arc/MetJ family transcriptional regulator